MIKQATIRLILSLAVSLYWPFKQLDFNNVFVNGDLQEKVYMTQPKGYENSAFPHHIYCLHKALYGLKQAPWAWFDKLKDALLQQGFLNSIADFSLCTDKLNDGLIVLCTDKTYALLVYVDDVIITCLNVQYIQTVITGLNARFFLKDLGNLSFFLGIEVLWSSNNLILTQSK